MSTTPHTKAVNVQIGDRIEDMIRDLGQEGFRQAYAPLYEKLETDSKKSLYLGCTTVATYLTMGWRKQIKRKHVRLLGRK